MRSFTDNRGTLQRAVKALNAAPRCAGNVPGDALQVEPLDANGARGHASSRATGTVRGHEQHNETDAAHHDAPSVAHHDAHVHIALSGANWKESLARHAAAAGGPDERAVRAELARYQAAGVAYVRDGGDKHLACMLAARLAPEYGIEYAAPAFPIFQRGNYGAFIGRGFNALDEYEQLVEEAVAAGASFVKIMTTGILDFTRFGVLTGHSLPASLVRDMVARAHERGLAVMSHTNGVEGVRVALAAGADSIEHGYYLDAPARAALAESGAVWVPTLAPVCNLIPAADAQDCDGAQGAADAERDGADAERDGAREPGESGARGSAACGFDARTLKRIRASQLAAVADVAARGGLIACGSDAGASNVFHARGAQDERALLEQALGPAASEVLARGFAELRRRFPPCAFDENPTQAG